jgi:adenine-specific DNA-methyltransferase
VGAVTVAQQGWRGKQNGELIALAEPERFVCLVTAFDSNDQLKTNTVLQMKDHGIKFRTV